MAIGSTRELSTSPSSLRQVKKAGFSLIAQISLLILVFFLIPTVILEQFSYFQISGDLNTVNKAQMQNVDHAVHQLLLQLGNGLSGVTLTDADWTEGMVNIEKRNIPFIKSQILNAIGSAGVTFGVVTDLHGNVLAQAGDQPNFTHQIAFHQLIKKINGKQQMSGIMLTPNGFAAVSIAGATNNNGNAKPTGYILFGQTLNAASLGAIKNIIGTNIAIESTTHHVLSTNSSITPQTLSVFQPVMKGNGEQQFHTFITNGMIFADYSSTLIDMVGNRIGLLYTQKSLESSTKVSNDLQSLNRWGLVIGGILLILMMLILIIRLRPMQRVAMILAAVSEGALTETVPASYLKRRDEVGVIANATSGMIENLHHTIVNMIHEITNISQQMSSASQELSSTVEDNVHTFDAISQTAESMAKQAASQADSIQNITHTLREMGGAVQQMVKNSDLASQMAGQASNEANNGLQIIELIKTKIEHIHLDSKSLTSEIEKLGARSVEIRNIVDVISDISEQTHLLSLNAAIESARAGEHGKGFAVVAQEVQKLADQSGKSAGKISELVNSIQSEMQSVMSTATRTGVAVNEGFQAVIEAGGAFSSISQAIEQVAEQIMELLAAIEQMSASEEVMETTMGTISQISLESAKGSKTVSSMTENEYLAMTKLKSSAEALKNMAISLHTTIERFRL